MNRLLLGVFRGFNLEAEDLGKHIVPVVNYLVSRRVAVEVFKTEGWWDFSDRGVRNYGK